MKKGMLDNVNQLILIVISLIVIVLVLSQCTKEQRNISSKGIVCRTQLAAQQKTCVEVGVGKACIFPQTACAAQNVTEHLKTKEEIMQYFASAAEDAWWMTLGGKSENLFNEWFGDDRRCMAMYIVNFDKVNNIEITSKEFINYTKMHTSKNSKDELSIYDYLDGNIQIGAPSDPKGTTKITNKKWYVVARVSSKNYDTKEERDIITIEEYNEPGSLSCHIIN